MATGIALGVAGVALWAAFMTVVPLGAEEASETGAAASSRTGGATMGLVVAGGRVASSVPGSGGLTRPQDKRTPASGRREAIALSSALEVSGTENYPKFRLPLNSTAQHNQSSQQLPCCVFVENVPCHV